MKIFQSRNPSMYHRFSFRFLMLLAVPVLSYITTLSCKKDNIADPFVPDEETPTLSFPYWDSTYVIKDQDILLWNAYLHSDMDSLNLFIEQWKNAVPAQDLTTQNDTLKHAALILEQFYSFDSSSVERGNNGPSRFFNDVEYIVLDTSMQYRVIDAEYFHFIRHAYGSGGVPDEQRLKYIIEDFRPVIQNERYQFLFTDKDYFEILNFFLNEETGYTDSISANVLNRDLDAKFEFLSPKLQFRRSRYYRAYEYRSYPWVFRIDFQSDFKRAMAHYHETTSEFASIRLKQTDGFWQVDSVFGWRTWD